ncbi:MAG TPA: hypothetical protein VGA47_07775 [Candidatus Dormibacteraeota bacterium]
MPITRPRAFGLILGLCVGGGVVLVNSIRYGFSGPLLVLGIVLLVGFGGLSLLDAFVSRRTHLD